MDSQLTDWVSEGLKQRGWSHGELSRRAGISRPLISQVLAGDVPPSADFCIKIAHAFGLSPVLLLVKAGILSGQELAPDDPTLQEIIELARSLSPEDRSEILEYVRFRSQRRKG